MGNEQWKVKKKKNELNCQEWDLISFFFLFSTLLVSLHGQRYAHIFIQ